MAMPNHMLPVASGSGKEPGQEERKLRLYVDFMSQPSRAVVIFSRCNGLPVEVRQVLIHKGETRSPAYLSINPLGKVPLLEDPWVATQITPQQQHGDPQTATAAEGCLRLPESAAIMSYLSYRFPDLVSENWYPRSDFVARAQVDSALHWYQGNIRAGAMRLVFHTVIAPKLGMKADPRVAKEGLNTLKAALASLESYWLAAGRRPFMTGPQPCAADLLAACELEQLRMLPPSPGTYGTGRTTSPAPSLSYDNGPASAMQELLAPYPAVRQWLQRVREVCEPHYGEAHRLIVRAAEAAEAKAKEGKAQQAKL
ncbi:hypothetical protein Agub_g6946 [Astrephomene gubernaculifera]|uniref:Glutathione S-transferase n=1 Tax=Astrephomene gubernaculifera TaxID=47775 RepID=A0AAD3DS08_9CHLO|nr:hypothetical protein Agub_g6946 [Astrephomene gubernaculifera]